jgi:hypothetical protein
MALEKLEILTGMLKQQTEKYEKIAELMKKDMYEHGGAAQALAQLGKQMPGFATSIEERIEKDPDISGAASVKVLEYSKNIIARFMAMCESNATAQTNQKFVAQGRMEAALQSVETFKKEIETHKAFAARREELAEENRKKANRKEIEAEVKREAEEAAAQAQQEMSDLVEDSKPSKGNGVPAKKTTKRRKATTKKKAAAKRKKSAAAKKSSQSKLPLDSDAKTEETDPKPDGDHT